MSTEKKEKLDCDYSSLLLFSRLPAFVALTDIILAQIKSADMVITAPFLEGGNETQELLERGNAATSRGGSRGGHVQISS